MRKLLLVAALLGLGGVSLGQDTPPPSCADLNADDTVDIGDPVVLLRWLFLGGPPLACAGTGAPCGDINGDAATDMEDAIHLLDWLFIGDAEIVCVLGCESAEAPDIEGFTFIECNAQGYPEYTHDPTGILFVRLPGGTFQMGSPEGEPYHQADEGPVHEVALSPFLIAKYELTQGEWAAVMGNYPSRFDGGGTPDDRDRLPVEWVSWDDIQEFEAATGLGLPTEAQWEYACRGGTETAFSFGSGESCADWECTPCPERDAYMWYCGNAERRTHEVGTKAANPFGLHDMHGNVLEWCEDVYSSGFYSTPEAAGPDPLCTSGSGFRVFRVRRGGFWRDYARGCRSSLRRGYFPWNRIDYLGFRPSAPSH